MAPAVELLILMELQAEEEEVVSVVAEEEVVAELPQQVETTELPQEEVLVEGEGLEDGEEDKLCIILFSL